MICVFCCDLKPCEEFRTYTARKLCEAGLLGDAIYKELKTQLCRMYPDLVFRVGEQETEAKICELLFGKADGWKSFFDIYVEKEWGEFCVYFDELRYPLFIQDVTPRPPPWYEAVKMVKRVSSRVFSRCQRKRCRWMGKRSDIDIILERIRIMRHLMGDKD